MRYISHSNYLEVDRLCHYNIEDSDAPGVKLARAFKTGLAATFTGGLTATGSTPVDFSGVTGAFKFPSGASTGLVANIIDSNAATLTLTAAQTGSLVLLDHAAGTIITLPAPVVGLNYNFVVTTSITSGSGKVITDVGTTLILGGVAMLEAAGTTNLAALFNGTTHIAILMNGTTTGGLIGTGFNLTCVTATQWAIEGIVAGSGTLATCASTS